MSQIVFAFILIISLAVNLSPATGQQSGGASPKKSDEPRFSIGLGVLAPSYSQKFDGNGRLDFNQEANGGFSFSLNNMHSNIQQQVHAPVQPQVQNSPSQDSYAPQNPSPQYQSVPETNYQSPSQPTQPAKFMYYYSRPGPKQVAEQSYNSGSTSGQYQSSSADSYQPQSGPGHYDIHSGQYNPSQSSGQYVSHSAGQYPSLSAEQYPSSSAGQYPSSSVEQYPSSGAGQYTSNSAGQYGSLSAGQYPSQPSENYQGQPQSEYDDGQYRPEHHQGAEDPQNSNQQQYHQTPAQSQLTPQQPQYQQSQYQQPQYQYPQQSAPQQYQFQNQLQHMHQTQPLQSQSFSGYNPSAYSMNG